MDFKVSRAKHERLVERSVRIRFMEVSLAEWHISTALLEGAWTYRQVELSCFLVATLEYQNSATLPKVYGAFKI